MSDAGAGGPVLVVVPTYNERDNLAALLPALLAQPGVRVLVVDDASPDGTAEVADRFAASAPNRVEVLHRSGPRGLGLAYVDGLRRALATDARLIVQMDADLSHDPAALPSLVAAAADADVVIGSRYLNGVSVVNWPLSRLLLSVLANRYVRMVTRLRARDCTSGFRCWRRETLAALPLDRIRSHGYAFFVEMLYEAARGGRRIVEVPIIFVERREGVSKLSWRVALEAAAIPWRLVLGWTGRRSGAGS
jgi:dolichol-phosphate mannosyltransferase